MRIARAERLFSTPQSSFLIQHFLLPLSLRQRGFEFDRFLVALNLEFYLVARLALAEGFGQVDQVADLGVVPLRGDVAVLQAGGCGGGAGGGPVDLAPLHALVTAVDGDD